ncbi:Pheophytinase, chloroplastic [Glycine max]|nr:Pheophytinase, chloroplastic [Glycine max]
MKIQNFWRIRIQKQQNARNTSASNKKKLRHCVLWFCGESERKEEWYNIPELAKKHKVYALDLLGFGWSDKALINYDAMVWRDQVVDFVKEIVKEPAVLVGNSLGGFTALVAATGLPDLANGVALLNSAGQFGDGKRETKTSEETALQKFVLKPLKEVFQRVVLGFLFWQAKQPARILSVLKSVYINSSNVDDYLVESITRPAQDPNAGEVYYRYMIISILISLNAGHCPHDETPELVNKALLDWLTTLTSEVTLQTV